jgi:hypothetical protein
MDKHTILLFLGFITCASYYIAIEIYDLENSTYYGRFRTYQKYRAQVANSCKPINEFYLPDETFYVDSDVYPKHRPAFFNRSLNFTCLGANSKPKMILLWNKDFTHFMLNYGTHKKGLYKLRNCPVTNCEVTTDRKSLNNSKLILISMNDRLDDLPRVRLPDQRWIFDYQIDSIYNYENRHPHISLKKRLNITSFNGLFNLTSTYRLDSNFTSSHLGKFNVMWEENEDFDFENKNFLANKTKLAFQVVSRCNTSSNRDSYVKELQRHMQVDVYGRCGNLSCPNLNDTFGNEACKQ